MLSPAGCQNSCSPAPLLLQARLRGSALSGGLPFHCPGSLKPACVAHTTSPPFLPSSVVLLSTLGSGESILLVFWRFSGLFRQMWVESKWSAGCGEPSVLLCHHLLPSSYCFLFYGVFIWLWYQGNTGLTKRIWKFSLFIYFLGGRNSLRRTGINSSLNVWRNSPMKPSVPGLLFVGSFLNFFLVI